MRRYASTSQAQQVGIRQCVTDLQASIVPAEDLRRCARSRPRILRFAQQRCGSRLSDRFARFARLAARPDHKRGNALDLAGGVQRTLKELVDRDVVFFEPLRDREKTVAQRLALEGTQRERACVDVVAVDDLVKGRSKFESCVGVFDHGRIRGDVEIVRVLAQNARGKGVKRRTQRRLDVRSEPLEHTSAQFGGCFARKREQQDVFGLALAGPVQVLDPVDDRVRLAGASAGIDDCRRAQRMLRDCLLFSRWVGGAGTRTCDVGRHGATANAPGHAAMNSQKRHASLSVAVANAVISPLASVRATDAAISVCARVTSSTLSASSPAGLPAAAITTESVSMSRGRPSLPRKYRYSTRATGSLKIACAPGMYKSACTLSPRGMLPASISPRARRSSAVLIAPTVPFRGRPLL